MINFSKFLITFLILFVIPSCFSKKDDNLINTFLLQKLFFSEDSSSSVNFNPDIQIDVGNGFQPQLKGVLAYKTDKKSILSNLNMASDVSDSSVLFSLGYSPETGYTSVSDLDNLKDRKIKIEENTKITYGIYNGTTTAKVFEIGIPYIAKSQGGKLRNPHINDILTIDENRKKFITLIANISEDKGATGYVIDDNKFEQLSKHWPKIKQDIQTSTVGLDEFLKKPEFNKVLTGKSDAKPLTDSKGANVAGIAGSSPVISIDTVKKKGESLINKQKRTSNNRGSASISNLSFDSKIRNMSYIKDMPEQLDQPEELETIDRKETKDAKDNVTVCTVKKYKAAPGYSELSILDPGSDVIWPGALIKGETIMTGEYTPIRDVRSPLTISASLQSNLDVSQTIQAPSLSTFRTARNKILAGGGQAPLNISYTIEEVHSSQQMALAIGANFNMRGPTRVAINGSFNFNKSSVKSRFMVKFIQKYYTIDIDIPAYPSLFFENPATVQTESWGISPMYVSSVTYGRMILVTVESEQSSQSIRAALNASFRNKITKMGGGVSVDTSHKKTLSTSSMKAYIVGGSGNKGGAVTNVTTIEGVMNLINSEIAYYDENGQKTSGATSLNISAGAPIAYKLRYLKDNSIGNIILTSEYNVRNCVITKSGKRTFKLVLNKIEVVSIDSERDMEFDIQVYTNPYINNSRPGRGNLLYYSYKTPSVDEGSSIHLDRERTFTFTIKNENALKTDGIQIYAYVGDYDPHSSDDLIQKKTSRYSLLNLQSRPSFKINYSSSEGEVNIYYTFSEL